jgi:tetratricopeptide (TPR) repeat protein
MPGTLDLADAALRDYDGVAALNLYDRALGGGGDRAAAGRVRALWLLRRWDEARAQLAELVDVEDSVHVALARGVVALGQPDCPVLMIADLGSALRDDEAAQAAFADAVRLDGRNAVAVAGLATALRTAGHLDRWERLLADVPPSAPVLVERAMREMDRHGYEAALGHANQAIEIAPGDVRAELVRNAVLRQAGRLPEALELIERLLRERPKSTASMLEYHGWVLYELAALAPGNDGYAEAKAQFVRSTEIGPVIPGAVLGIALVDDVERRADAALSALDEAIAREPMSPQLNRNRAAIGLRVAGPDEQLSANRRVLDLDPRDLEARLAVAYALHELGRTEEATAIVTPLREEFAGNQEVLSAWAWLHGQPWEMPEPDAIRTRLYRPWVTGEDDPQSLLEPLMQEAIRNLGLSAEAAERLRRRIALDSSTVLQSAYDEEQAYLRSRNDFRAVLGRERMSTVGRYLGRVLIALGGLVGVACLPLLLWKLLNPLGMPLGWELTLPIGVTVALAAIGYWRSDDELGAGVMFVFFVAVPIAFIWQGIEWYGLGTGIVIGVAATVVVLGALLGGLYLEDRFVDGSYEYAVQHDFDRWQETLYGKGVLPAASEAGSTSAYSTRLPVYCRVVSDAAVDIGTAASRELRELLLQRSKGSFALAGPRGAGKSTLLERWCAGEYLRVDGAQNEVRRDLTVKVDAPVGYESKEFLVHLFGRLCDAVESYVKDNHPESYPSTNQPWTLSLRSGKKANADPDRQARVNLVRAARQEREKIRYLRSRTTEGELSIGAPPMPGGTFGVKGKVSVRRDDVPLNHPELVDGFRAFLGKAAEVVSRSKGKVLIGIDELDRISGGDEAQRFLNELKAVFNVPSCYFLVSVSEDALADFELSAMGMRTAFDSAFDTIVRVDYLRFHEAKVLLNRRIIDLPEQFAALAYALSGGLARELARTADVIGRRRDSRELPAVTAHLVQRLLERTSRAAMDRLTRSSDRRAGAVLIPALDEHPVDGLSGDLLRDYAARVAGIGLDAEEPEGVAAVRLDVAVMTEYLATLLDVFDGGLDRERMAIGLTRGAGDFETLARVRRYLGANPYGARELLRAFAKAWDLSRT